MVLIFLVCGVLAGFGAYRYGAARASMRQLSNTKNSVSAARKTAWRHAWVAVLFLGGVILLLFIAAKLGGLPRAGSK